MSSGDRWQVVLHNDDFNIFGFVLHVLRTTCGFDDAAARAKTNEIHHRGRSVAGEYPTEAEAEAATLALMRVGLHATFGKA